MFFIFNFFEREHFSLGSNAHYGINQFHYHAKAGFYNHCGPECDVG